MLLLAVGVDAVAIALATLVASTVAVAIAVGVCRIVYCWLLLTVLLLLPFVSFVFFVSFLIDVVLVGEICRHALAACLSGVSLHQNCKKQPTNFTFDTQP
jgi:hypothetical protein